MRLFVLLLCVLPVIGTLARAEDLTVAAAADLSECLPQIDAAFEKANPGAAVKVAFGSSGNFRTQIENGAPFEVFLSADMQYPAALAKEGLAGEAVNYAEGRIVLWTTSDAVDVSRGLAVLKDAAVKRVAIANPDHAPYGRAAKAALESAHLWDELKPKLVIGENIAQTAQFVQTGNADAGFVAMSLVVKGNNAKSGRYFEIPADQYPAIVQAAVVTKEGSGKALAKAYVDFLKTDQARGILRGYGFKLPK